MIQKFRKEDVWGLQLQFMIWLFDRDPYFMVYYYSPHWVGISTIKPLVASFSETNLHCQFEELPVETFRDVAKHVARGRGKDFRTWPGFLSVQMVG